MTAPLAASVLLILLPIAFNLAFAGLAMTFDYPSILRRPTDEILDRFRRGGPRLVLLWWGFAMTAVLFAPLAVLVAFSLDGADGALLAVGAAVGVLAAAVQFLGLIRWAFLVPHLARANTEPGVTAARKEAIDVVFQSFNRYLGVAVGEHLGYLLTGSWSILVGAAMLQSGAVHPLLGVAGIIVGVLLAACSLEFVGPLEPHGSTLAAALTPASYVAWSLWLLVSGIVLLF